MLAARKQTVAEADVVLARLDVERLLDLRQIQGRAVTIFGVIIHLVEHFSMHTGQIILLTKMRTGKDLRFYDHLEEKQ